MWKWLIAGVIVVYAVKQAGGAKEKARFNDPTKQGTGELLYANP